MPIKRLIAIPLATLLIVPMSAANAEDLGPTNAGVSLAGTPVETVVSAPNSVLEEDLTVHNDSPVRQYVASEVSDFVADGQSGESKVLSGADDAQANAPFATWSVVTPAGQMINPGEVGKYHLKVTIPARAEPGGHYGAVGFGVDPTQGAAATGSQVSLQTRVYKLILLTVSGKLRYTARIRNVTIKKALLPGATASQTLINGYRVSTLVQNLGNSHFRPVGSKLDVHDLLGSTVAHLPIDDSLAGNSGGGFILPHSTRKYKATISGKSFSGIIHIHAEFAYGNVGGPYRLATYDKWVFLGFAWWMWAIIGLSTTLVVIAFSWVISMLHRWSVKRRPEGKAGRYIRKRRRR